jgi:hypothetical protein
VLIKQSHDRLIACERCETVRSFAFAAGNRIQEVVVEEVKEMKVLPSSANRCL